MLNDVPLMSATFNNKFKMSDNNFDPTWRELLSPIILPRTSNKPEPKPVREPYITKTYVHLAIKFVDHPNDFNLKLQMLLENRPQRVPKTTETRMIDQDYLPNLSNYFKIPLEACKIINNEDENLKVNIEDYLDKILLEMPAKEFVQYGVIIQTFNIDYPDVFSDFYKKRVDEIVNHFINESLVINDKVRGSGLIQVFLYINNDCSCKRRLFTQYSKASSKDYIADIVKDFINHYNSLNELELIIDLLFLDKYNLSKTLYSNFEKILLDSLRKRLFFAGLKEFMTSPVVISATHGLQCICKDMIKDSFVETHMKSLINQIHENYILDSEQSNKLHNLLHDIFCVILSCQI